jgi:hypothetical protein
VNCISRLCKLFFFLLAFTPVAAHYVNGDCCSQEKIRFIRLSDTTFARASVIAVDQYDQAYILDAGTNQVLKFSPTGESVVRSGGYGWTQQAFDQAADIATVNGLDVFVADYGNHRIQRFDRNLNFISSLPAANDDNRERPFGYPRSVAAGVSGAVYVVDGANNRLVKIDTDGSQRTFGGIDAAQGRLRYPTRVRLNENELVFVQDSNTIVTFDRFGNYVRMLDHRFQHLTSFTIDGDTLYALDSCQVLKMSERGTLIASTDDICSTLSDLPLQFVDFVSRKGKSYFLTEHALYTLSNTQLFDTHNAK